MSKFITEEDRLLGAFRAGYNAEPPAKGVRLDQTPVHITMPMYRQLRDCTEEAAHLGQRLKRSVHENAPMCSICNEVDIEVQSDRVTDCVRFVARCKHRDCIHVAESRFEVRIDPRFNPADYLCDFREDGSAAPAFGSKSKTLIQATKPRNAPMELADKPKTESPDSW